ncbi:hypothetical protein BH09VER1_BH09VER1_27820 [soil metagenome]
MKLKFPSSSLVLSIALLTAFGGFRAMAEAPADGVLLDFETDFEPSRVTAQQTTSEVIDQNGGHALKINFTTAKGYPAAHIAAPPGGWDLSKYKGVEAEITNAGNTALKVALRVDNAGDWSKGPWNTESVMLKPGDTKVLQVVFGQSYGGNKGFDLDPSQIIRVVFFAENPGEEAAITVDNIKGFDPK